MNTVLASGHYSKGFAPLQTLLGLVMVAVLAMAVNPRTLITALMSKPLEDAVFEVQRLTDIGGLEAIMTGVAHRILFQVQDGQVRVRLERYSGMSTTGAPQFASMKRDDGAVVEYLFPEGIRIAECVIKGIDEAAQGNLKDAWFYLLPQGVTQHIILTFADGAQRSERMVLYPFSTQFTVDHAA